MTEVASTTSQEHKGKRRVDMSVEERRAHDTEQRRKRRMARTPQKKTADRRKDALYQKKKRDAIKTAKQAAISEKSPHSAERLRQSCYNSVSKMKNILKRKALNDQEEAAMSANLFFRRTPTKRAAKMKALLDKPRVREDLRKELFGLEELPAKRRKLSKPKPGPLGRVSFTMRTARKHAHCQLVKTFYKNDIISRVLPHMRYATKAGPGRILLHTLKEAYAEFKALHPNVNLKFSLFASHRPKEVRLLGSVPLQTCLCVLCTNVGLKVAALNENRKVEPLRPETKMLTTLLCPFPTKGWPKMDCIQGDCGKCRDLIRPLTSKCQKAFFDEIRWKHWERTVIEGKPKLDLANKTGTVGELLEELAKDLQEPTKGRTFIQHLFTAYWQKSQFDRCQNNLQPGQVMLLQDFAENRKAVYPDEVKAAHFGKRQITLHPTVCFFKDAEGQLVRQVHMFLTDDISHDYHAVHHFTNKSIQLLEDETPVDQVIIWSDGAASQYKGKGNMGDLTLYGRPVQRNYFGSEHGKGESDAENGRFAQRIRRAASKGLVFRNASDLAKFGTENVTETSFKKYTFIVVPPEDIKRDRPESDVATLPGTRSLHQIRSIRPYRVKARKLSCFCTSCVEGTGICANDGYVSPYNTYKLKTSTPMEQPESEGEAEAEEALLETDIFTTSTIPSVGERLEIKGQLPQKKGKTKEMFFYAVVQESPILTENFFVEFLKATKVGTFIFNDVPDRSEIAPGEPCHYEWRVVPAPKMLTRPGSSRSEFIACQYLFV